MYIDIWSFYGEVKFASLCICMGEMLRISNDFSPGASGPMLLKFYLVPPWGREMKLAKIVVVHWPRWPPCPYMVKTFKKLRLQNRGRLQAESLHKSSGTGGLPKLLKWWSYIVVWFFTARSSLLPYAFVWAQYIFYRKNLLIFSNDFSSEASGPMLLKLHAAPPWGRRMKACLNGRGPLTKMAAMHVYGKDLKNLLLQNQISPGP